MAQTVPSGLTGAVDGNETHQVRVSQLDITPAALAGCSPAGGAADEPREDGVVLPVTAVRDAVISSHPLGDVGIGALVAGEQAGATCFVPAATTNIGSSGSAVQVRVNGDTGYVPVQMVDPETDEPAVFLEQDERWLRNNLPSC